MFRLPGGQRGAARAEAISTARLLDSIQAIVHVQKSNSTPRAWSKESTVGIPATPFCPHLVMGAPIAGLLFTCLLFGLDTLLWTSAGPLRCGDQLKGSQSPGNHSMPGSDVCASRSGRPIYAGEKRKHSLAVSLPQRGGKLHCSNHGRTRHPRAEL